MAALVSPLVTSTDRWLAVLLHSEVDLPRCRTAALVRSATSARGQMIQKMIQCASPVAKPLSNLARTENTVSRAPGGCRIIARSAATDKLQPLNPAKYVFGDVEPSRRSFIRDMSDATGTPTDHPPRRSSKVLGVRRATCLVADNLCR